MTTASLEKDRRWSSPWYWRIDDGPEHLVDRTLPAYRRFSTLKYVKNQKLTIEEAKFTSNGDVYFHLGSCKLEKGEHTFTIRVNIPRPGGSYVTTIEGILLRPRQ
ncbi:MAG: hypothetical protein D6820_08580 [Lentisphaerae bacterium]|nr:MAG: hypothetical protein D6820_08580 [Lentisphaerota bacterium]